MWRLRGLSVIACLGLFGCADPVNGELYIETEANGDGRAFVYQPCDCADGEPLGFFGVEMKDEGNRVLQFYRNGEEPGLIYFAPGGGAFELGPRDCSFFEGSITRKYNRVTNDGRVHGDLTIECVTADGRRVEGDLTFEKCDDYFEDEWDEDDWDDDDDWWDDDDDW